MDFKLKMGRLLAIFGVHLSIFFLCGLLLLCVSMGYLFHVWGVVGYCNQFVSVCLSMHRFALITQKL